MFCNPSSKYPPLHKQELPIKTLYERPPKHDVQLFYVPRQVKQEKLHLLHNSSPSSKYP